MWVARDKNGVLLLFRFFPKRLIDLPCWRRDNNTIVLDSDLGLFPNLKWEDDPVEVSLILTNFISKEELDKLAYDKYPDYPLSYGEYESYEDLRDAYKAGFNKVLEYVCSKRTKW